MSTSKKAVVAAFAVAAVAPLFAANATAVAALDKPAAPIVAKPMGTCSGGQINWVSDGGLGMSMKPATVALSGDVTGCKGTPGVTSAQISGVQTATSASCANGVQGPVDVNLNWSNGKKSRLAGNWTVPQNGVSSNVLHVVSGWGEGENITIATDTQAITPAVVGACMGNSLNSGTTDVSTAVIG